MKTARLTVAELDKICKAHRYILARHYKGHVVGMNCRIATIARRVKNLVDTDVTKVISYAPCDFMTYITYKLPLSVTRD